MSDLLKFSSTDKLKLKRLAELYNRDDISDEEYRELYAELIAQGTSESLIQQVLADSQVQEAISLEALTSETTLSAKDQAESSDSVEPKYWSSPYDDVELKDTPEQGDALAAYYAKLHEEEGVSTTSAEEEIVADEQADNSNDITQASLSTVQVEGIERETIVRPVSSSRLSATTVTGEKPSKQSELMSAKIIRLLVMFVLGTSIAVAIGVVRYTSTLPNPDAAYVSADEIAVSLGKQDSFSFQFGPFAKQRCDRRCTSFVEQELVLCLLGCERFSRDNFASALTPFAHTPSRLAVEIRNECGLKESGVIAEAESLSDANRSRLLAVQESLAESKHRFSSEGIDAEAKEQFAENLMGQANDLVSVVGEANLQTVYRETISEACVFAHQLEVSLAEERARENQNGLAITFYLELQSLLAGDILNEEAQGVESSIIKSAVLAAPLDSGLEPVIDYTEGKWRLSPKKIIAADMVFCPVFQRNFRCSAKAKKLYGHELELIEAQYALSSS